MRRVNLNWVHWTSGLGVQYCVAVGVDRNGFHTIWPDDYLPRGVYSPEFCGTIAFHDRESGGTILSGHGWPVNVNMKKKTITSLVKYDKP